MLNRMNTEKVFCGLDIGSNSLKAALIQAKDKENIELLGAYHVPSQGYKNNSVSDLNDFSECIHNTLNQLSTKSGVKIKDVYLGLGGQSIEVRPSDTIIPLVERGSKVIHQRDLTKVNHQARLLGVKMEEEILHDLPQSYIVDDVNSVLNPIGLYGRKLGVHTLMVVAHSNRMRNIVKAVNHAGFDVAQVYFGSYISHKVAITHEQRMEGCMMIDFGAKLSQAFVFKEGVLKSYEKIDIGADDFTQAISDKLSLPFDLAEEIKQSYADVAKGQFMSEEEILVKKENNYLPIKRQTIFDAIEPITQSLISRLKSFYHNSGSVSLVNCGAVVIGGGALLPGLIERLDKEVIHPVHLGKIDAILHKNISQGAVFVNAVSLALKGMDNQFGQEKVIKEENWWKNVSNKMRELYHEYF